MDVAASDFQTRGEEEEEDYPFFLRGQPDGLKYNVVKKEIND